MDSNASTLVLRPQLSIKNDVEKGSPVLVFDTSLLQQQANLPTQFLWPHEDLTCITQDELEDPPVDLNGFFNGDEEAISLAALQIRAACSTHGFFQVINHGVDSTVIRAAHQHMNTFFDLPMSRKFTVKRNPGSVWGYSAAHADRYSSKLPWKETFSFGYSHDNSLEPDVINYFKSALGEDFEEAGWVYQKYCEAMRNLSLVILELLEISLGVDKSHYRKLFEEGNSLMRCNSYPPCKEAGLTLGTGPHCDPNSLTILHQDQVGGLEIFANNKWLAIRPRPDAFVVNIGDTFMALCNGRYKSCLHRAVVNKEKVRRSLVYFVSPKEDKILRPPQDLLRNDEARKYPDFKWSDLLEFTQKHYRADATTLQNFAHWLLSSKNTSN
ncbi:unnamed protein product [Fraxinus pennsylvanica]|uniref:Fe2OG dioxygenase domain-containing protein n=1 Tax=Fraxinus pennsylvanica TaxID=56036 RepID=A0AAD2DGJ8_9LAMI|nr:unnamed protein product [Fraxinus pennsylvanica]